ncbi:3-hydroxyacyl-ACP dehydratase FabZ [Desulfocastanea catecholica]
MDSFAEITSLIPHRAPFLWVDTILSFADDTIVTEKTIPTDLDIFTGHYPGKPIMPGVLLCEAIFQSGALLMGKMGVVKNEDESALPVLTRITNAKFKRSVLPGDTVRMQVKMSETISSVSFFKGKMTVGGKTAVQVDFACTISASIA